MRQSYPRPELLVEPDWLAEHLNDTSVRVVDMRPEKAYAAGHIPGAVRIDDTRLRNADERATYLPSPAVFVSLLSRAGIDNESHVVIYDDEGGRHAARLWYLLAAFGHTKVSLLNGGLLKWLAQKRPTATDVPCVRPTRFRPTRKLDLTCPLPQLLERKPNLLVLDVRSEGEFSGKTTSPGSKQAGRVPGAVHVEWKENVSGPNFEFKPAAELLRLYAAKGVTPDKEIVTYCASGGRAAQTLFTLRLLGFSKVRVYYGSFMDYSALPNAPIDR